MDERCTLGSLSRPHAAAASPRTVKAAFVAGALFTIVTHAQPQPLPLPLPLPAPELIRALRFTIEAFVLEGNTLVPSADLQEALKPFLGSGKRPEDMAAARRAVLEAYRRRGYELVSVGYDQARSRGGAHYLVVRELRIGKIRVTGIDALTEEGVRAQLPALNEGEMPRLKDVARQLFLFNDNPGRTASLDYTPGEAGLADVEVKLTEQRQLRGAFTLENSGTSATGRWRIGGLMTHANLWDRGHSAVVSYTTSERPVRVGQYGLNYRWPLPALGDSLDLYASYSDADSGRVAEVFTVSGKGSIIGGRYQHNLVQDARERHMFDFGYEERRYRDTIDFFGTNLGVNVNTRPLSAAYQYRLQAPGRMLAASAGYWRNLTGGSKNDDATYNASRSGARAGWQAWRLSLTAQQALPGAWIASLRTQAQYTGEPLIAGEQFALGGARAVRGFAEREAAGDLGWRANLELYAPQFFGANRLLAFFDVGAVSRRTPLPGELVREGVSSLGIGWRYAPPRGPVGSLDWAVVRDGAQQNRSGEHMLQFSLIWWSD